MQPDWTVRLFVGVNPAHILLRELPFLATDGRCCARGEPLRIIPIAVFVLGLGGVGLAHSPVVAQYIGYVAYPLDLFEEGSVTNKAAILG